MKTAEALVACSDLSGYAKFARAKSPEFLFNLLSGYYEFLGDVVAAGNGEVIKFMGDSSLILFAEGQVDAGMEALLTLQSKGDAYLAGQGMAAQHQIRTHYGPVCIGELGVREKRMDILGSTVNTLFLLKANAGFVLTPEVFRKLGPGMRQHFKKHTPPITYIPIGQAHRD